MSRRNPYVGMGLDKRQARRARRRGRIRRALIVEVNGVRNYCSDVTMTKVVDRDGYPSVDIVPNAPWRQV